MQKTSKNRIVIKYSTSDNATLMNKEFPDYLAYLFFLLPLSVVLVILWIITASAVRIKNIISPYQPTYEDADKWFREGKGYCQNLSEQEKEKYLSKEKNLPLGL